MSDKNTIHNLISKIKVLETKIEGLTKVKAIGQKGEVLSDVEYIQPFGWFSKPKANAEGVCLAPNGSKNHAFFLSIGDRTYHFNLENDGEAALSTQQGQHIYLKSDGSIEIKAPKINVVSEGSLDLKGNSISLDGSSGVTVKVADTSVTKWDQTSMTNTVTVSTPLLNAGSYGGASTGKPVMSSEEISSSKDIKAAGISLKKLAAKVDLHIAKPEH